MIIKRSSLIGNVASFAGVSYMYGDGASRIVSSTIAGNRSTSETGGIYFSETGASLKIYGSTISGNVAAGDSGGISARNGDLSVINSTVAGNRAGGSGGGIWALSPVTLNAVTIARNLADADGAAGGEGGGLYRVPPFAEPVEVENSLIALNRLGNGTPNDCSGIPFASLGHNLISAAGPSDVCKGFDQQGDRVRPDPRLGKLGDNGGPTETIALRKASPAINQADSTTSPNRDQRGVRRQNPDIGAFERR